MQNKNEKSLYFREVLGKVIRQQREEKTKLSGNKLANEYDIGNGNLSRIENGVVDCKFITIWKIVEALGVDFAEFSTILKSELGNNFKLTDE
ncbi:MAG: helix-turn-helix domain-containing protein [bacterium]|nr:helix-turn-helix domain-containing protein [bacterium]